MNKPKFNIGDEVYIFEQFLNILCKVKIIGIQFKPIINTYEYSTMDLSNFYYTRQEDNIYTSKEDFINKIIVK